MVGGRDKDEIEDDPRKVLQVMCVRCAKVEPAREYGEDVW